MHRVGYVATLIMLAGLAGCATPAGQLKETDFNWTEQEIAGSYERSYRDLLQGFRACKGGYRPFGHPPGYDECYPELDGKSAVCDVYAQGGWGGKVDVVMGRITLKEIEPNKTLIRAGSVGREQTNAQNVRRVWINFANGSTECELPKI